MQTKFYNKRDKNGRFAKVTNTIVNPKPKTQRLVNHFSVVVDGSGSMAGYWKETMNSLNSNIETIFRSSKDVGQLSYVDVLTFAPIRKVESELASAKVLDFWCSNSMTPLTDSICAAIEGLQNRYTNLDDNNSYAVIIITDGIENASSRPASEAKNLIQRLTSTGLWTFAVACPFGNKQRISIKYGIPEGNITEWESSTRGATNLGYTNTNSIEKYTASRSCGATSVSNFYVDANNVEPNNINQLASCKPKHRKVEREMSILEFFGNEFALGKGYYELTKKELVQDYKDIILYDKLSDNYYRSSNAMSVRAFLGMSNHGSVRMDPRNLGYYKIFIQSTSDNRKLVRGTTAVWL